MKRFDFLALGIYCGFIYGLSDQTRLEPPIDFGWFSQDKIYHAGAYFIMGLLAWQYLRHYVSPLKTLALFTVGFCSLYGMSDEFHQSFVLNRSSDIFDWLADTVGAAIAAGGFFLYARQRLKG